jgi:hypothetical protein
MVQSTTLLAKTDIFLNWWALPMAIFLSGYLWGPFVFRRDLLSEAKKRLPGGDIITLCKITGQIQMERLKAGDLRTWLEILHWLLGIVSIILLQLYVL